MIYRKRGIILSSDKIIMKKKQFRYFQQMIFKVIITGELRDWII